jgi:hypothetical protein
VDAASLSARRLLVYVDGLPDGARTWGYDGWSMEMELRARLLEFLDLTRLDLLYALTGSRKVKSVKPVDVPRPESVKPRKTASQWVAFARNLAGTLKKKG